MSLYVPELDLLFVHIPKTGGTWVGRAIEACGYAVEQAKGAGSHNLRMAYGHDCTAFTVIRHPLAWYTSVWRGLKSSWGERRSRDWSGMHRTPTWSPLRLLTETCGDPDFSTFVRNVLRRQPGFYTRMVEWYVGPPGAPLVDLVGRTEMLVPLMQEIVPEWKWPAEWPEAANVGTGVTVFDRELLCELNRSEQVVLERFGGAAWFRVRGD